MKKNVASQLIGVQMTTAADGTDFAGAVTCTIAKDGAAPVASGGTGPTLQATGYYEYNPTQAETNYDHIAFHFTGTGAITATVQVYTHFPQTVDNNVLAAGVDGFAATNTVVDTINTNVGTAGAGLTNLGASGNNWNVGKTGYAVLATGLDAVLEDSTFLLALENQVWDAALTGGSHNISTSAGRRLRQIDAAFVVTEGTADAGGASTIDLETGVASTVDDIYNGDRILITAGTGAGEHGLILDYVGSTQQATMSKAWVTTPDATSEYILVPADCDVELWNDNSVTGTGDWSAVSLNIDQIESDTNELQTDWTNAGRLDTILDAIPTTPMRGTDGVSLVVPDAAGVCATPAQVNAEVLDVLNVDTFAEPGQGAPAATISLAAKINYLYKAWRNLSTMTATEYALYNDDAATIDHKAVVSDNGTTATKGEVITGA